MAVVATIVSTGGGGIAVAVAMTVSVRRLGISRPLVVSVTVVSTMVSTVGIGSIGSVAVAVAMAIIATVVSNGRVAIAVTMAVAIAKSVAGISLGGSSGSREQAQGNNTNGLHLKLISVSLRSLQGLPM